jgi:hypothetical protein
MRGCAYLQVYRLIRGNAQNLHDDIIIAHYYAVSGTKKADKYFYPLPLFIRLIYTIGRYYVLLIQDSLIKA